MHLAEEGTFEMALRCAPLRMVAAPTMRPDEVGAFEIRTGADDCQHRRDVHCEGSPLLGQDLSL